MADVDIDRFGNHGKTDEHPDEGKNIPLNPEGGVINRIYLGTRRRNIIQRRDNSRKKAH